MKTNKEKALEWYKNPDNTTDKFINTGLGTHEIVELMVKEVIEIASKPDWYYPEKGEYPDKGTQKILVKYKYESEIQEFIFIDLTDNFKDFLRTKIEMWTYLPEFNKD
jgi:hypothetical protein